MLDKFLLFGIFDICLEATAPRPGRIMLSSQSNWLVKCRQVRCHPCHIYKGQPQGNHSPGLNPASKVHGANMGPNWGRQARDGPHVGLMNFAFWDYHKISRDFDAARSRLPTALKFESNSCFCRSACNISEQFHLLSANSLIRYFMSG